MEAPVALDAWLRENARAVDVGDRHLVAQAACLFERAGVHLLERRERGVDPVARLDRLHAAMPGDRTALYRELIAIFAEYGDRHSRCVLPPPWNDRFAYLPFVVGACVENETDVLLVTGSASARLRPGDRLVAWNGRPVNEVLEAHAAWQLGANAAARRAKAVQTLTIRPLGLLPPPEGEVELVSDGPSGRLSQTFEWQVAEAARLERDLAACAPPAAEFEASPGGLLTRRLSTPAGPIGWIRIPSLRIPAEQFLPSLAALLDRQPSLGLVLDLRGCEEGFVQTAERMLQLFADRTIEPLSFELRATEWIRDLVRTAPSLAEWRAPVEAALAAGRPYSAGRPLTPRDLLDEPGRRYRGRLLVLVDALTYSSAEMFAAGVQDHGLGKVMGVAPCTGGGGGSAWSQDLVHRLSGDDFFARVPGSASLRMAVLRCRRTGANEARLIEGDGVIPDTVHAVTRRDLLLADADLVERAKQCLGGRE